jgi:hypothetical protein
MVSGQAWALIRDNGIILDQSMITIDSIE